MTTIILLSARNPQFWSIPTFPLGLSSQGRGSGFLLLLISRLPHRLLSDFRALPLSIQPIASNKFLLFESPKMTCAFLARPWLIQKGRLEGAEMSQLFSFLGNQGYCYDGCGRRQGKQDKKRGKYLLSTFDVQVLYYHLIFVGEETEA